MSAREPGYAYIWEYIVREDRVAEFEHAYGGDGDWVALFRRAPGYLRTVLHRDRRDPHRYVTVDYWESAEAWEAFRTAMSAEFEVIDAQCEDYTLEEREIGVFDSIG